MQRLGGWTRRRGGERTRTPRVGRAGCSPCSLPSSSLQGALPQPPPVDVMAAPALSWCLSLLAFLLPLAIARASTAANGEDPGIWTACSPSGRRRALLLGRRAILKGRRREKEGRSHGTPFPLPLPPLSCPHYTHMSLQATARHWHLTPVPPQPCSLWDSVLSSLKWVTNPFSARQGCLASHLVAQGPERGWRVDPEGRAVGPLQPALTPPLAGRHIHAHLLLQLEGQHLLCLEPGWGPAGHILPHPRPARQTVSGGDWPTRRLPGRRDLSP